MRPLSARRRVVGRGHRVAWGDAGRCRRAGGAL